MTTDRDGSPSLRKLAAVGTAWITLGYGISQLLRLGSNLILTHLLAPNYFGIMAIVNVVMIGLAMFSDVGIGPSIIQHERGADRKFLDTAWTIQVIRGGAIWLCCLIGAWPFSVFYGEPLIMWLIPVAGLSSVIAGFNSTGIFTANRNLALGYLTLIEIGSQAVALVFMVAIALITPSVWVLVYGGLISAFVKLIASHVWMSDVRDKFCWDKSSVNALTKFGRWIFVSTMMGFVMNSAASLILGKFMNMTELGLFSIAATLSKIVEQIYQQISNKILFPIYSKLKHLPISDLRKRIYKIRLVVMAVFLPPLWTMVIYGQSIINLLFDPRYHDSGWILSVYAAGYIPIIVAGLGPFYLAMGNSSLLMKVTASKLICYLGSMIAGWYLMGTNGIIYGMAFSNMLAYCLEAYVQNKYGVWIAKLDLLGIATSLLAIGIGFHFK